MLTAQFGKADSYYGNIIYAGVAGTQYDLSISDTLNLTQTVQRSVTFNFGISQTLTLTSAGGQSYPVSADNTLTLTDTADTSGSTGNTEVFQTLNLTQTVVSQKIITLSANNVLSLAQTDSDNHTTNEEVSQTLTFVDQALRIQLGDGSDTLTMTHTISVLHAQIVSANSSLVLSQTVTESSTFNRLISQGLVLIGVVTKTISKLEGISHTLILTQLAVGISSKLAINTIVITDEVTVDFVKTLRNVLDFDQIASENHTSNRHLFSNFIPFQIVAYNWTIRRTLTQSLVFSEIVTVQNVKFVQSILNFTQDASADVVKPAFSTITITSTATLTKTSNKRIQHTIFLSHGTLLRITRSYQATNILAFNQFAKANKAITVTAENTLTLNQQLIGIGYDEAVTQALSLSHVVDKQKIATKIATNILALDQTVAVVKTLNLTISQQLSIIGGMKKYVGLGNITTIDIPEVQVVKVENFMVLQSDTQVITLPAPEFGDGEGARAKLNIKRAMGGDRYVYKKDAPSSRLSYELTISRKKAIEFRNFLMNNNSKVLTLHNWKGEIWAVLLTNNPFIFTEVSLWDDDCGNKVTIPLEFEGVRLN